jgi:hypothetical protein
MEEAMTEQELMDKWLKAVQATGFAAKGSIREYKRNCGKKSCRKCKSGEGHPTHQMTYYLEGKQHSSYVGHSQLEQMRQAIANGRELEELMVRFGQEYLVALKNASKQR